MAFADLLDARLLPVHVLPDESAFPQGDPGRKRERFRVLASIEALLGTAGGTANGRREPVHVQIGGPAERLAAVAGERGAAMLVVGSHGGGTLRRAPLGSVAAELINSPPCPVLVVPPGAAASPDRPRPGRWWGPSVVCGIDGSARSLVAAGVGSRLARRTGRRLVFAHAYRPDPGHRTYASLLMDYPGLLWRERQRGLKLLKAAEQELTRQPVPERRLSCGEAVRALSRLAGRERAELIVVGSRARGALRADLVRSVCGGLAASAPVPVLVVPSRGGECQGSESPAAGGPTSAT